HSSHICYLHLFSFFFFFNAPPPTEIYTLSLHDALPILDRLRLVRVHVDREAEVGRQIATHLVPRLAGIVAAHHVPVLLHEQRLRSEEHTSELQSLAYLVCRLLLEKKKKKLKLNDGLCLHLVSVVDLSRLCALRADSEPSLPAAVVCAGHDLVGWRFVWDTISGCTA